MLFTSLKPAKRSEMVQVCIFTMMGIVT